MMQHPTNDILLDYIHGELAPARDAFVYAHLEQCETCRADYEAEIAVGEMLRANAAREERELPASVKAEIWKRVREAQPSVWNLLAVWARPAVAIPVAAAIAIAAYFGTTYIGPQGAPSIEASYYLQDHADMNGTIPFSDHNAENPVELENAAAVDTQQTAVNVQPASYTADANP
ncbi:MAG TPA: zf-HC2 domain-containing protein [Candidatus Baltobacteraceae bacterium]|nr:zf-HC2 domain-containing protein [Candidatus Baltobacteraceae bacterium]